MELLSHIMNKSFISKVALSVLFVVSFTFTVDAQMCGKYRVSLEITDENNKPVNDAAVEFFPITKDETRGKQFVRDEKDFSKFSVEYLEGQNTEELHKLVVSAKGYKTAETKFRFDSCQRLRMQVKMPEVKSSALPIWSPKNQVFLAAFDENRKMIKDVRISIIKGGKILKTVYSKIGGGGVDLDYGKYVFRFEKKGFQTENINLDADGIFPPISIIPDLKSNLKKAQTSILTGTAKLDKKIVEGAVIKIRDADHNEYVVKTDEKGVYRVTLPFGQYFIYSTVNDECWMCAEFYQRDFLINKEGEIRLNMELQFYGEG